MSDLHELLAQLRDHIEQKGMDGVAIPDPDRSGRYLVYGSARLLACATTELQLYGHRPMFEADDARWFKSDEPAVSNN